MIKAAGLVIKAATPYIKKGLGDASSFVKKALFQEEESTGVRLSKEPSKLVKSAKAGAAFSAANNLLADDLEAPENEKE